MSEKKDDDEKIIVALAKRAYDDLVAPGAKEVGNATQMALSMLFVPIFLLNEAKDRLLPKLSAWLTQRFEQEPEKKRLPPAPNVTAPALLGLTHSHNITELRELYLRLLVTAMTEGTAENAHPSFASIIQQMSPEDAVFINVLFKARRGASAILAARVMKQTWSNPSDNELFLPFSIEIGGSLLEGRRLRTTLENLERLKLVTVSYEGRTEDSEYEPLIKNAEEWYAEKHKNQSFAIMKVDPTVTAEDLHLERNRGYLRISDFGIGFCFACCEGPDESPLPEWGW